MNCKRCGRKWLWHHHLPAGTEEHHKKKFSKDIAPPGTSHIKTRNINI
jgi:hypothetical protein